MNSHHSLRLPRGFALWFTGMPSSGKTTIARELHRQLDKLDVPDVILDGDEIRPLIAADLDRSNEGRHDSLFRYLKLVDVLIASRVIVIVSVINHSERQRQQTRQAHPEGAYAEVWVKTPKEECHRRDVKGHYAKAGRGEMEQLVGYDIDYEEPQDFDIIVETQRETVENAAKKIIRYLCEKGFLEEKNKED